MLARYSIAALLAVIFLLAFLSERFDPTVAKISEELFLALSAAIVIVLIIDVPSREELRDSIKAEIHTSLESVNSIAIQVKEHALNIEENAYKTAFKGQIPRDFVDTIQRKAFSGPFLRETLQATWRFDVKDDRLIAQVDSRSILKNVTSSIQYYRPKFYFDKQGNPRIQKIIINTTDLDVSKINFEQATGSNPDLILELPEQEIQPNAKLDFFSNFTFERNFTDWELWTTLYPCRSMNLRVIYPDPTKWKREYFNVVQLGDLFHKRHEHDSLIDIYIEDQILPDQGLVFSWRFVPV